MKLHEHRKGHVVFHCPGCGNSHEIPVAGLGAWTWNQSMEAPTFHPSIFVNRGSCNPNAPQCHSWVREGKIEFLNDCTHKLAGQTVELPEWE